MPSGADQGATVVVDARIDTVLCSPVDPQPGSASEPTPTPLVPGLPEELQPTSSTRK